MVRKHHKDIRIKDTDTVLITFTPSPGMEVSMYNTMNQLAKAGAKVLTSSKKVHVSGHGSQEDLKMMLNLNKTKILYPNSRGISHANCPFKIGASNWYDKISNFYRG